MAASPYSDEYTSYVQVLVVLVPLPEVLFTLWVIWLADKSIVSPLEILGFESGSFSE